MLARTIGIILVLWIALRFFTNLQKTSDFLFEVICWLAMLSIFLFFLSQIPS